MAPSRVGIPCLAFLASALFFCQPACALSPDSPEVQALVQKGVGFLTGKISGGNPGGTALVALALVKCGKDEKDSRVAAGIEAARNLAAGKGASDNRVYSLAMAMLLFCSLEHEKYKAEIDQLLDLFLKLQKENGGWGYTGRKTGDTSMTQYAVLSLWEAAAAGHETPVESWEKVTNWLIRTQDPGGGYGYQGEDPGNFTRVAQDKHEPTFKLRPSMAAAGLGSLYICQDHLRLPGSIDTSSEGLPTGFQRATSEGPGAPRTTNIDVSKLHEAQGLGRDYLQKIWNIEAPIWQYYWLYSLERYETFRTGGRDQGALKWYDEGVAWLQSHQADDGGWNARNAASSQHWDTSFALLFLVRSTQKSLKKSGRLGSGLLVGGRGVPKTAGDIEIRDGRVAARALEGPAEQMLSIINDPTNSNYLGAVSAIESLKIPEDPSLREQLQDRLRQLAGGEEPEARLAAVTALGRVRDLDNVPILIYALSDPDPRVMGEARRGLELISRKLRSFGPTDNATEDEVRSSIELWKQWYLTLRPDAEFPE